MAALSHTTTNIGGHKNQILISSLRLVEAGGNGTVKRAISLLKCTAFYVKPYINSKWKVL